MTANRSNADRARAAIPLLDLTDLADDHSAAGIDRLCQRAAEHQVAAVCVWPEHVSRCVELLADSGVGIATVVNFPQGNQQVGKVLEETLTALSDGATEIDVVMPFKMFRNGDVKPTAAMIEAVGDLVAPPGILKVILETSEFVKTSTGKAPGGATLEAARVMLGVIAESDRTVGIKPSGGVKTFDDAIAYLDLAAEVMGDDWALPATFRFGASSLLDALLVQIESGMASSSSAD
jgi:deoxyribose-phosphate aldolase